MQKTETATQTLTDNQIAVLAQLRSTLAHAVTRYDMKQAGKRGYNRYALGMYLGAVQDICSELRDHPEKETRAVIVAHFNGRLLDHCLRACGFAVSTRDEQRGSL